MSISEWIRRRARWRWGCILSCSRQGPIWSGCVRWPGRLRRMTACALARLARCALWHAARDELYGFGCGLPLTSRPLASRSARRHRATAGSAKASLSFAETMPRLEQLTPSAGLWKLQSSPTWGSSIWWPLGQQPRRLPGRSTSSFKHAGVSFLVVVIVPVIHTFDAWNVMTESACGNARFDQWPRQRSFSWVPYDRNR